MEVVTAGAQDELMQSLDYKLKTSNTSYVTARHFPSSLSSFSPTTSRVCRIPLTSGTSFIDPESIKIAFRVRNTDGANPLAPATPNPACFVQRVQVFANGQRCDDINYYGRTVAMHDLLKGREYNRNKAMEGFDEVNDPRIARAVHQGGYADVLLRPAMVGILCCGKMLPPQLNLIKKLSLRTPPALWSENAGAHPAGATLSTDFEIQNVRVLASQVVLDSALVESFNRVLLSGRSLVFSYPTVHTQQSSVPNGVAEHNVTVARAFTKLMGAFVTFWDNDAGSKIHLLAKEDSLLESQMQPAVPSQPHEGSFGALPLPLRPCGHLRRHGAQHRHRPRGLPAPQLHCRLSHRVRAEDGAEWCQHPLGRPCPVHLQGPGRHDDGPVHSFGGLPAGDALRHGRLGAGLMVS